MSYSANLSVAGADGALHVVLVEAEPAPPARGSNTWTVTVRDAAGAPVEGATINVKAFMPAHGHSSTPPAVTPGADGTYEIDPLVLFMPGLWEITITVESSAGNDEALFAFCVAG
jgi:hypothetical protein